MSEHSVYVEQLCPELRAIIDAELAAGNLIVESWSGWGLGVLLKFPFRRKHQETEQSRFRALNDPHHWLAEYSSHEHKQLVGCRF